MKKIQNNLQKARTELKRFTDRWHSSRTSSIFFTWAYFHIKKRLKIGLLKSCPEDALQEPLAIVIPIIPKDHGMLEIIRESLKNICHPIGNVYIVAPRGEEIIALCKKLDCVFVDEVSILGYGKDRVVHKLANGMDRSGWLFHQFLKWSGDKFIKEKYYLTVDGDTVFIRPHRFITKDRKLVLSQNDREWHEPYFETFREVFGVKEPESLSFISHMMIYDCELLNEMKNEITAKYGKSWDFALHDLAAKYPTEQSFFAETEMYPNWLSLRHPERLQKSIFYNTGLPRTELDTLENMTRKYGSEYMSLSFHTWISNPEKTS